MLTVTFHPKSEIPDSSLKFAVICARYQGQWLFSRHRDRSTWEIPGGHREPGEAISETARRELWEETGTTDADIRPVCVYSVNRDGVPSYGMLCFAEATHLESIPESSEIAQVLPFERMPENLTYPDIQPHLYKKVQGWLNVQSGAGELWDVYDESRQKTGRLHRRGDELNPGEFHLTVHVWMQNDRGEFLMTRRSPNKGFPLLWESTGGSALAGEDSLTAALREAKEETGLALDPGCGRIVHQYSGPDHHTDVWLFRQNFDLNEVILQENEICGVRYSARQEILSGIANREIVPYRYLKDWMERGFLLNIRKAAPEDAGAVADLACQLWPEHSVSEMEEEFSALMNNEDAAVYLAEVDGIAVGFAQCQLRRDYVEGTETSPVGYLEGIYVHQEYRRKGIAKQLLNTCETWAGKRGCSEFASDCELDNYDSFRFHLALGFAEANRIICFAKRIGEKT